MTCILYSLLFTSVYKISLLHFCKTLYTKLNNFIRRLSVAWSEGHLHQLPTIYIPYAWQQAINNSNQMDVSPLFSCDYMSWCNYIEREIHATVFIWSSFICISTAVLYTYWPIHALTSLIMPHALSVDMKLHMCNNKEMALNYMEVVV